MIQKDFKNKTWSELLNNTTNEKIKYLLSYVDKLRKIKTIYPEQNEILTVLKTKIEDVKVVIIGQEPYCDGNTNGLAFGCKYKFTETSLLIRKAIFHDYFFEKTEEHLRKFDPTLKKWNSQGVFLLNSILTVEKNKPLSHAKIGWEEITEEIIKLLNEHTSPIVFLLWGNYAQNYSKFITNKNHLVLKNEHPIMALHNNKDWECSHFFDTNKFLEKHNKEKIKWI